MSNTILLDADESATLEATLAFVDTFDTSITDLTVVSPLSSSKPPARCLTPQQKHQDQHSQPKPKQPRRKYPNSSSTVLQRRKKAEILALRNQVEQLEVQLAQLKKVPYVAYVAETSTWAQQAAVQYQGRLQAEKTNDKLKRVLANQMKVTEALRTLVQKTATMDGMDFLHPDPCRPLTDGLYGMELLEKKVERLYLDADQVFQREKMNSISVQAVEKQNLSQGKTVEIMSTTPMMCPLQVASETLWKWFCMSKSLRDQPDTLERNYTLRLESQIGILEFRKQNFVRRYVEEDRVVVVWADILSLPEYRLQFRNEAWMFITPSADAPKDASVLRTFQQLFVDYDKSQSMQGASFAEESAFQELSKLYRRYLQSQQNVMMEETRIAVVVPGVTV